MDGHYDNAAMVEAMAGGKAVVADESCCCGTWDFEGYFSQVLAVGFILVLATRCARKEALVA